MSSWIVYATVVGLAFFSGKATADEEIKCACSPSTYEFTLDFSLTCPPVNVTLNDGIAATFCQISPFGEPDETIADLVPVDVDYIDVLELGQGFSVITQKNITGPFEDGDTFEYTSLTAGGDNVEVPKVLQLNIFAFNAAGEAIVNFYAISFTNICDEYPVLIEGGSAGWTRFTRLDSPSAALCPAAAVETDPPTILTSTFPPVDTEPPVGPPTETPVGPPTEPPTSFATTEPPVDPPTGPPAGPMVDTDPPTSFMSMDMSMGMVSAGDIMMDLAMSMDMSMSMAAESRLAFLRVVETKSAKSDKKSKKEKSEKSGKSDKKAKSDKSAKSAKEAKSGKKEKSDKKAKSDKKEKSDKKAKSDKSAKSAKEAKSGKKEKSDKKAKSDKKEKSEKRRLRIRPLFEAQ